MAALALFFVSTFVKTTFAVMRQSLLIALLCLAAAFSVQAQKFGYVYSEELLAGLDEMKSAESELTTFRDQQQKLFQSKIESFQAEVKKFQDDQAAGNLTPKQIQETQTRLQAKQEELGNEEQRIAEAIQKRRAEQIQPIFDKVNSAISAVAKEDQLTYVFDGSAGGVILYAEDSMNITSKVQQKLATM